MSTLPWTPWHEVVELRDDLKSGDLPLSMFAADLYDVVMERAQPVYQNLDDFFALTYPTFNIRELVKDVLLRLAGKNDRAVRQLELTYGGGKTHTLITLLHLVRDPSALPDLPTVREFISHAGIDPPQARVAVLPFDKLDVEKGIEITSPDGETRWLKQPWSVLAWQIAGPRGLEILHPDGKAEERESAPAEPLLERLLRMPQEEGLATLVLIDEVLMYAREKVRLDKGWLDTLRNFSQYLTQAAAKPKQPCCVVASLLATDPAKSDETGKAITRDLYAIFRRESEEGIQPVQKTDIAEVLRRRFFKPKSIEDSAAFRPHVSAALKGIADVDDQTKREGGAAEERLFDSYPFHPDLTEVLYGKWTNLEGFQRTRGVLRTFALALRDAVKWDQSPLVGCNVLLSRPDSAGISLGLQELAKVATSEEYEGKRQDWNAILEGELDKARMAQADYSGLAHREIEQAVVATFLHSQPIGQRASTPELMVLVGHSRPDRIELGKALRRWADTSWFLDEALVTEADAAIGDERELPSYWRLGSKPNLRQMHSDACRRVLEEAVDAVLIDSIRKQKNLTAGASAAGARVHNIPLRPNDIEDDGEFHYAVMGPSAASMSGNPSAEARRFINETTGADRPRVYRNAVVLLTPSRDGLEVAKTRVREYLAWEDVRETLKSREGDQGLDETRTALLAGYLRSAQQRVRDAIQQAYCIVVTVSEKNDVHAFKIGVTGEPVFSVIKGDQRSRIQEQPINAEALLPGGPYDLWREGETSRLAKDLIGAFAQLPHLPKMLRRQDIVDTLALGAQDGLFVLRTIRPDRSVRTMWRQRPSETDLKDPGLEVVLPEAAELTELPSALLAPDQLPELWPSPAEITVRDVIAYFQGGKVVQIERDGYTEPMAIPKAEHDVVLAAARAAVEEGKLWLVSGPASLYKEPIPAGVLSDAATLLPPPAAVPVTDILPGTLPDAWENEATTALSISVALSNRAGRTLPWSVVRDAIEGAIRARMIERTVDSGDWPCDLNRAQQAKFRVPAGPGPGPGPVVPPVRPGVRTATAELRPDQIQDLAEVVGDVKAAAVGQELKFRMTVELGGETPPPDDVVANVNEVLRTVSEDLEVK